MSSEVETPLGACPMPVLDHEVVIMGHGSGGALTQQLIEEIFPPAFGNSVLDRLDDQAGEPLPRIC